MSAASDTAVVTRRGSAHAAPQYVQGAATAAWICAIPCAAIAALAIFALGPPLGRLIAPSHDPYVFLSGVAGEVRPEPVEHARYLIAIWATFGGALATYAVSHRMERISKRTLELTALASQLALVVIMAISLIAQYRVRFPVVLRGTPLRLGIRYFTPATLGVAGVFALGLTTAARQSRARERALKLFAPSRRRHIVSVAVAIVVTAIWILQAVNSDASIANELEEVRYHLSFTLDETFAVLNGRTPLVNFTPQYSSLWPFLIALPMLAFGKTLLTFTTVLCAISALGLLAIYDVLRRAAQSSIVGLALYLPFLATSLFFIAGTSVNRSSVATYSANFPLRYAMPFFLAWLTTRTIQRGDVRPLARWVLFTFAGLAVVNNGDFGTAALAATIAAFLWTRSVGLRDTGAWRSVYGIAGGLITAIALVCALTMIDSGSLPQFQRLFDYARLYAIGGFGLLPIPGIFGMHLIIYLTYVAAIIVATVRKRSHARNQVLTGMLAWAGVFGIIAGFYWVGRSHPIGLKYQFSAWAFALVLLTIVAVQASAAPHARRALIGILLTFFGFGVLTCSLAQIPAPWSQIERLDANNPRGNEAGPLSPSDDRETQFFVASLVDGSRFVYRRGAPVAILLTTGHRVADAYGVVNVSPYTGVESLETVERVEAVLSALRQAGGNTVILPVPLDTSIFPVLERRGFEVLTASGLSHYSEGRTQPLLEPWGDGDVMKWVDVRHLHPRALLGQ